MTESSSNGNAESKELANDIALLKAMGYQQELARRMSGFSNYAISLSIICILAGGITSFHVGYCAIGGAAIGIGWPVVALFSLTVALTMGQVASSFPTAGGLYHWASVLGGKGWGWATAWFNLVGLVTVLAAINVGLYLFLVGAITSLTGNSDLQIPWYTQHVSVVLITVTQAILNYCGIRWTTLLTDLSGYLILVVAAVLTISMLMFAPSWNIANLWTFSNFSGAAGADVWPASSSLVWLFLLSFLLPAYTITGFDASAHTAEETRGAAIHVPQGIVRSVLVSGVAGWIMLSAIVISIPNSAEIAASGSGAFYSIVAQTLPLWLQVGLYLGIAVAQFICGLATVTSTSRMIYAFARDGGLPCSTLLKRVGRFQTPGAAIIVAAVSAILFTLYTPVYSTITLVCAIFLYVSYVIPTILGFFAYGKSWTTFGPWQLGIWYRPLAIVASLGCTVLIVLGMAPPNEKAAYLLAGFVVMLLIFWFGWERKRFEGPKATIEDL